ncbi:MAG TPA: hypothetical protein VGP46_12385 [Acidimicrobiales bacterium]|jgi:hypothetical protein|nr:hypothetical protein [Acidimicrobiales bacterium]
MLQAVEGVEVPELPNSEFRHPATVAWWEAIWTSPMAPEYDASDIHGLYLLADLIDCYWMADMVKGMTKKELAAEIRLQRQCFGLTPIDRRRLQWEIEKADSAQDAGKRRRSSSATGKREDPRLKAV